MDRNPQLFKLNGSVTGVPVNYLAHFFRNEDGAELAEYAVGTAILVAIAIIVYQVLGDAVNNKMNAVANEVEQ